MEKLKTHREKRHIKFLELIDNLLRDKQTALLNEFKNEDNSDQIQTEINIEFRNIDKIKSNLSFSIIEYRRALCNHKTELNAPSLFNTV